MKAWLLSLGEKALYAYLDWTMRDVPPPPQPAMPTLLKTIQGVRIYYSPGLLEFTADADIDSDGGPNIDGDPYWQPQTTLKHNGKSINAQEVEFVVIPIGILNKIPEKGLGCHCTVTNTLTGQSSQAVLADLGPTFKVGEISPALARKIGVNPNSKTGGESRLIIRYEIHVGTPATLHGITYKLQPLGK